jgi:hypothetical protein
MYNFILFFYILIYIGIYTTMPTEFQKKVFLPAVKAAKACQKANPGMTYMDCVKKAWKSPEIIKAKEAYNKAHPKPKK